MPVLAHSFFAAVRGLPDNPLARREWLGLARQSRDWRLWLGVRIPKDARGWGLPAVAWCAFMPYGLWAVLRILCPALRQRYGVLIPPEQMPDALALCFAMVALYVCLIAAALMAPSISREREKDTWDGLRSTGTSSHEILVGLLAGRLGPLLAALLGVGLFWIAALPNYTPLLRPYSPFRLDRPGVALLVWETGVVSLAVGTLSIAASALSRSTGRALVTGLLAGTALIAVSAACVLLLPASAGPLAAAGTALAAAGAGYALAHRAL